MTSKHDFKNLSYFLDSKKNSPPRWGEVQVSQQGESLVLAACDGKMMAQIETPWPFPEIGSARTYSDGAALLKSLIAEGEDHPEAVLLGPDFEWKPLQEEASYLLLRNRVLAGYSPVNLGKFGFFASHAATFGKLKTDKGKPAIIQLAFRGPALTFKVTDSTMFGVAMANSLLTEEADNNG
jgi:hypothetical protein